jgi:hypothetical protein
MRAYVQVGFYVNSWLTFMAVYLNLYALLIYSWAQATEIQAEDVQQIYNVQQVCVCMGVCGWVGVYVCVPPS